MVDKMSGSSAKKRKKNEVVEEVASASTGVETTVEEAEVNGETIAEDVTEVKGDAAERDRHGLAKKRKVIIVIEEARLEVVRSNKGFYELLNCDDHLNLHKKLKKNPADSRPDICHQIMLTLLDSPLNKAGHLQVYVQTKEKVLFEVSPHVRIPRTYKRFAGLMVQLLHKMRIKAADGKATLMKVIKGPVTRHLPVNCKKFGTSVTGAAIDVQDFVQALPDEPVVFVFGGMAHGHLEPNYVEQMLSLSDYPLSAACAIGKLMNAFERKWYIR